MQEVVVVLNGPHVKKWVWALCAWIEVFWAGRISRGVAEALRLEAPLLVCGDANGGEDLRHMVALAQAEGIETVPCENGKEKEHKNTRGDCLAAIREIEQRPDDGSARVHRLIGKAEDPHIIGSWPKVWCPSIPIKPVNV